MARKNSNKATRKDLENAIRNLAQGYKLMIDKITFIENFIKSTDLALDLYVKFKGDEEKFKERIEEFNKEAEAAEKEVAKEEKTS
jgi:hypothetical protein